MIYCQHRVDRLRICTHGSFWDHDPVNICGGIHDELPVTRPLPCPLHTCILLTGVGCILPINGAAPNMPQSITQPINDAQPRA